MFDRIALAQKHGLDVIYCADTGRAVGKIEPAVFENFVRIEEGMHGLDSDDNFLDELQLSLIPMNSRPSPIFQNMSPDRYNLLVNTMPDDMYLYLLGRLVFERFNSATGIVISGGKTEWLKSVTIQKSKQQEEALKTLIRLDRVFGARKVFLSTAMLAKLNAIREEWPGQVKMNEFIEEVEAAGITALANYDTHALGRLSGNLMAHKAMMNQIAQTVSSDFEAEFAAREAARMLAEERRSNKVSREKARLKQLASNSSNAGEVEVHKGYKAIVALADIHDKFDKNLALDMLSKLQTPEHRGKLFARGKEAIEARDRTRNKPGRPRKAKAVFDIEAIFTDL